MRRHSRDHSGGASGAPRAPVHVPAQTSQHAYEPIARVFRDGPASLLAAVPGQADRARLHIAFLIPPFSVGSGGHNIVFQLLHRLERKGHTCSIWIIDPYGMRANEWPAFVRESIRQHFAPINAPVHKDLTHWHGADVVVATSWETAYAAVSLEGVRARAYLVNDHEPEFFPTSVDSFWASQTYRLGMYGICGSPWLRDLYIERYGGLAEHFDYGVDHDVYRPRDVERRRDTVVFYSRDSTPRRAVALGVMALAELRQRLPDLRVAMFGDRRPLRAPFPYDHYGIASPAELSWLFSEGTVGLCLSMTNYSLIPQEMLACGLPCVDLRGTSAESVFGLEGPVPLAAFHTTALADRIEELLRDPGLWSHYSNYGLGFVAGRTWDHATNQVEHALRRALRLREEGVKVSLAPFWMAIQSHDGAATPVTVDRGADSGLPGTSVACDSVSQKLVSRLGQAETEAVIAALEPDERAYWQRADEGHRKLLTLAYGVHHEVPSLLERTGLRAAMPPENVHSMARDALAAGGGYWYADLIASELARSNANIASVERGLDFGCSSGRVVRVLGAAFPDAEWHGCDPNQGAIEWAQEHLPEVRFAVSPLEPPLPYPTAAFDLVFAISIWSHFGADAAVEWLGEMARIIRPGGHLFMTTHGWQSVAYHGSLPHGNEVYLEPIRRGLYRTGFSYWEAFGEDGDWGVVHPQWGMSFMTREWLEERLGPSWRVARYSPGRIDGNQDAWVLRRT